MFYLLDPEKWERQKHFEYYMQMIPCGYTVTVRLDVKICISRSKNVD